MSRNWYSEINLHMVWHCKESMPFLTPTVEPMVFDDIRSRIIREEGAVFHEIGGTESHIHDVTSIPPTLHISEWIGRLKGGSSFAVNHVSPGCGSFEWQTGYGVVSFATRNLGAVRAYVRNQKEHHAKGTTRPALERWTPKIDLP